jgi:hypothetical protein
MTGLHGPSKKSAYKQKLDVADLYGFVACPVHFDVFADG